MPTLYDRLAATAAADPGSLALVCGERTLSRADLIALADAQAARWAADGLGEGDLIGWLGHNSPEMIAALLACARLGAVFVPLNWRLTAAELADIADHAGLSALGGTPELVDLAAAVRARCPPSGPLASRAGGSSPADPAQPGDAMLVYTSGTTGRPKGAMHTHGGMLANIDAALAVQPIDATSRVMAVLPLFHVGGLCIQVLPALAAGAVVNLHARFDPAAWLHEVAAWRATTSLLVPAVMRALIEHPAFAVADLSSLRFLNSGSQVVPEAHIVAFHARGIPVAQVYGSTETGPVSLALHPDEAMASVGQVGRPAPGVVVRLADEAGAEVPAGAVGEIWLRAPNLMRGYHRDPQHAATAGGWFRTGDLACRRPGGGYEVVGRSKDLIISGGENIHPAEIENLLAGWPGLADAAVVALPDARWGEVPVLVLQMQPGARLDRAALQARFDERLARFKHPRQVLECEALPRTALGKVQRALLVQWVQAMVAGMPGQAQPSPDPGR